jgi:hypothetical protein
MAYQFYFYATPNDLRTALGSLEAVESVKYVFDELYESAEIPIFQQISSSNALGESTSRKMGSAGNYVLLTKDSSIPLKKLNMKYGQQPKYEINATELEEALMLVPSGIFDENGTKILTIGMLSAYPQNQQSIAFFKRAKKLFLKEFERASSYYVGPEASKVDYERVWLL